VCYADYFSGQKNGKKEELGLSGQNQLLLQEIQKAITGKEWRK